MCDTNVLILDIDISCAHSNSGHGTAVMSVAANNCTVSDSSFYGFCSLSQSVSTRCRNAVSNPNKAIVTINSATAEVMNGKKLFVCVIDGR